MTANEAILSVLYTQSFEHERPKEYVTPCDLQRLKAAKLSRYCEDSGDEEEVEDQTFARMPSELKTMVLSPTKSKYHSNRLKMQTERAREIGLNRPSDWLNSKPNRNSNKGYKIKKEWIVNERQCES